MNSVEVSKSGPADENWWGLLLSLSHSSSVGLLAQAQQPGKIFRIGFLDASTASGSAVLVDAFRARAAQAWVD